MKKSVIGVLISIVLLIIIAWAISPVRPVSWQPDADNGLSAAFSVNKKLYEGADLTLQRQFLMGVGQGPEDIVISKDGYLYTGYEDGRIIRAKVTDILNAYAKQSDVAIDIAYEEYVNTKGRPLGLRFDGQDNLIVADGVKGLLRIDQQRNIQVLVDEYNNEKLLFVDHLDIARDGTIWFSDASAKFSMHDFMYDFLEASATGRLFSYDPKSNKTQVRMENLFFSNGVALGPNEEFVLVNETGKSKIHRLWLKGEKAGVRDIFIENLPAMPDNVFFKDGIFWVSLVALRDPLVEGFAQKPLLRRIIGGLPKGLLKATSHYGFVVGISPDGEVLHNLQSSDGYQGITTAIEFENHLLLGSLDNDSIGIVRLK